MVQRRRHSGNLKMSPTDLSTDSAPFFNFALYYPTFNKSYGPKNQNLLFCILNTVFVYEMLYVVFNGVFCIWDYLFSIWDGVFGIWDSVNLAFGMVYFVVAGLDSLDPRISYGREN